LKRFNDAKALLNELYDKTQSHIYLHQLGMVAREAGDYIEALNMFEHECSMLTTNDHLGKAANMYEQALVNDLLGNQDVASKLATLCLALSLSTEDNIMHGCAYRLMGDLFRKNSFEKAKMYYRNSLEAFEKAKDNIACNEIKERLNSLNKC